MDCPNLPDRPQFRDEKWGLLTIPNDAGWRFGKHTCHPPSELGNIPAIMAVEFAIIFNRSNWGRQKHQWAIVTGAGGLLRIKNIPSVDRPSDPTDFPPGTRIIIGTEAEEAAAEENRERHRLSMVPREWTVAIRPLLVRLADDSEAESVVTVLDCPIPVCRDNGPAGWLVGRVGSVDWVAKCREEIGPLQSVLKMRLAKTGGTR